MQPPIWGFLQPCLLLLLAGGPKHGYSLMEELQERNWLGQGGVDVGNLYRTLRRMEAEGLVESGQREPGPGPTKRVYKLTGQGEELLRRWAGALEQRISVLNRFLDEFHLIYGPEGGIQPAFLPDDEENPI